MWKCGRLSITPADIHPFVEVLKNDDLRTVGVSLRYYDVVVFAAAMSLLPQHRPYLKPIIVNPPLPDGHIAMVYGDSADKAPQDKQKNMLEGTVSIRSHLGHANSPSFQYHYILRNLDDKDTGLFREYMVNKENDEKRLAAESKDRGVPVPLLAERKDDGSYPFIQVHFVNGLGVDGYVGTAQHDGKQFAEFAQAPGSHTSKTGPLYHL